MEGSDRDVIEELVRLFNRMLGPDGENDREAVERLWVDEPEIVHTGSPPFLK